MYKSRTRSPVREFRRVIAFLCTLLLVSGDATLFSQETPAQSTPPAAEQQAAKLSAEELDSLVAPIALYPDPLLSQTLVASTYPLEIIQLQQWLEKHKGLKEKELTEAVKKENWDPSIQAMAALPDVVKRLAENIKWTTDLGNAFLAQQSEVMDAVQRMRKKAKDSGNLKTSEQQKVETKVVENKSVIVVEQASPDVIYVPSYNPTVVYGAPVVAYPPIYYPPPGYYAAGMAISFGVGVAMGAAWGGGWGWGAGWGGNNDITINRQNNFVNNSNRQNVAASRRGGNTWQHNPQHRGAAPYSNRETANRYGGTARGESVAARQASARQQTGSNRAAGGADRGSLGGGGGGGANRVGNRDVANTPSSRNTNAFGGAGSGMTGAGARASSSRGASSLGGSRGGGRSFGGGGRRGR
jgi:hypothetical protein